MDNKGTDRFLKLCNNYIFPLLLLLYAIRHVNWGLDLWDTGYNYANFKFMGTEHMDSMWLFSTYLANAVGHILTFLPGGSTLLGLNLYTGLFAAALAVIGYFFCTVKLKMPQWLIFGAELIALSLCWCPTALLYNYLTYAVMLGAIILLYQGLAEDKNLYLIFAGVLLGTNVFVRFSNLPQMAFIVAVWAYGIICRKNFKKVFFETLYCMAGYFGAVVVWLGYISVRYGFSEYVSGIARLFGMTDTATDYKASSMLLGMFSYYIDNLYWLVRIMIIMVPSVILWFVCKDKWKWPKRMVCVLSAVLALAWLYTRGFCTLEFTKYSSILRPGIMFLTMTILLCMLRIFMPRVDKKEKLLAGLVLIMVLITSIGSNNGVYPSINNLFLALPYVVYCIYRLCAETDLFPAKSFCIMILAIVMFQSVGFGMSFAFAETNGVQNPDTKVENNDILKGVYMNEERAVWLSEITEYVRKEGLFGKEVILYGEIPALSFYLDMPSAFNPWSDLRSYGVTVMEQELELLSAKINEKGKECPVIILERSYADYLAAVSDAYAGDVTDGGELVDDEGALKKFALIAGFMEKHGYTKCFSNSKFTLYRAEMRNYD